MIKYFQSNRVSNLFLFPIIILIFWIPSFRSNQNYFFSFDDNPALFAQLFHAFFFTAFFWSKIFAFVILLLIGFILIRLNIIYYFIYSRTQLPLFFFLLFTSHYFPLNRFAPVLISCLLLIWAIFKIIQSLKHQHISYNYFDVGCIIGTAGLFYQPVVFYIFIAWIGMVIFRNFSLREWIFSVFGLLLPYLFIFSYFYLFDKNAAEYFHKFFIGITVPHRIPFINEYYIILWIYMIFMILIASIYLIKHFNKKKIQARKIFLFFFWIFLCSICFYLMIPAFGIETIFFAAIPLSYLLSNYYSHVKSNWINNLLLLIMIFGFFFVKYYNQLS